jgi:predicted nuclease of predicted toxin-antitoxin system
MALDLGQSSDLAFWERAATEGAVIIRKDEDFARLTLMRPERVSVLWLRIGNCRTAVLLATLGPIWLEMLGQFDAGARLVEVH